MKTKTQRQISFLFTLRNFLFLTVVTSVAILTGCATDPVTGRKELMFMTQAGEINLDRANSPHQFSADYGAIQDTKLNRYLTSIGNKLAAKSHRPNMPYTFRGVNAVYANAYAFPGGSIAITRGMLINMNSEAELAALLGHEIGHVCARHAAEKMTSGMLLATVVMGATAFVQQQDDRFTDLTYGLGTLAVGALLAHYSRDDERESDELGIKYMTSTGYNPNGGIDLMATLRKMSKTDPSIIELMFATHPMGQERYETAVETVRTTYQQEALDYPLEKERYLDRTAALRKMRGAIEQMQKGEKAMNAGKFEKASTYLKAALKQAPQDYACLLMLAKCCLAQKKYAEAEEYSDLAKAAYPGEAQAFHISGMAKTKAHHWNAAYAEFKRYEEILPGNPNTIFFMGYCMEGMRKIPAAAKYYRNYLYQVKKGAYAQHAYKRLVKWGYIKPDVE